MEQEKQFNNLLLAIYYDDAANAVNQVGLIAKAMDCPVLIEAHKTLRMYLKLLKEE